MRKANRTTSVIRANEDELKNQNMRLVESLVDAQAEIKELRVTVRDKTQENGAATRTLSKLEREHHELKQELEAIKLALGSHDDDGSGGGGSVRQSRRETTKIASKSSKILQEQVTDAAAPAAGGALRGQGTGESQGQGSEVHRQHQDLAKFAMRDDVVRALVEMNKELRNDAQSLTKENVFLRTLTFKAEDLLLSKSN